MARYNYEDPNAIRYNSQSLLPTLVQVPKEAPAQFENWLQNTGRSAGEWIQSQAVPQFVTLIATGRTPIDWAKYGGAKALNNPVLANGIATFAATQFGRPVLNGVKHFANSPAGKKIIDFADWIF